MLWAGDMLLSTAIAGDQRAAPRIRQEWAQSSQLINLAFLIFCSSPWIGARQMQPEGHVVFSSPLSEKPRARLKPFSIEWDLKREGSTLVV